MTAKTKTDATNLETTFSSSPGDEKGFSSRRRDPVRVHLPHLFGSGGYVVIRHPAELPSRLPLLYARLTAGG